MTAARTNRILLLRLAKCLMMTWLVVAAAPLSAQFYNGMNTEFGKNRVQWKNPKWNYYRNDIFDVYFYGTDEYGVVSSSPFNWGITPYFSMAKGRLVLSTGINYSSCSRTQEYDSDVTLHSVLQDKWQEV